jgi:hypothetical protein
MSTLKLHGSLCAETLVTDDKFSLSILQVAAHPITENKDSEAFYLMTLLAAKTLWRVQVAALAEWYYNGKTKVLRGKPVPLPLCPSQIPHGLALD